MSPMAFRIRYLLIPFLCQAIFLFCRSAPPAAQVPLLPPDWVNDPAYQFRVEGIAPLRKNRSQSETQACTNARARENREFSEHMVGIDLYTACQLSEGPGNYCDWHYRLRPDIFVFQAHEISRKFAIVDNKIHCMVVVEFYDPELRKKTKEYAAKIWGR